MPATLQPPSSSSDLVAELQELERRLKSFSAPSAEEQACRDQLASVHDQLREQQRLESLAQAESQRQQEQTALANAENDVRKADSLCQALRIEVSELQRRLVQAEFQFNHCLRNRGEIRKKLGVN